MISVSEIGGFSRGDRIIDILEAPQAEVTPLRADSGNPSIYMPVPGNAVETGFVVLMQGLIAAVLTVSSRAKVIRASIRFIMIDVINLILGPTSVC